MGKGGKGELTSNSAYVARRSGSFTRHLLTQSLATSLYVFPSAAGPTAPAPSFSPTSGRTTGTRPGSSGGSPCTIAVSCANTFEYVSGGYG